MSIQQLTESTTQFDYKTNMDPLMTMREAAEYLAVSAPTMYELVKKYRLPVVTITKDRKIRKSTLDKFISENEAPCQLISITSN